MDWKSDSYDSILVIVNRPIKMIYYKLIKVIIDALGLAEVSGKISRFLRLYYCWPRVFFHFEVIVITMLFLWHQIEAINRFLFSNK